MTVTPRTSDSTPQTTGVLHDRPAIWIDPRLIAPLDEIEPSRRHGQRVPRGLRRRLLAR